MRGQGLGVRGQGRRPLGAAHQAWAALGLNSEPWSQNELGGGLSGAGADEIAAAADSRGDGRGQLLLPLRGGRRDGHDPVAKESSAKLRAPSAIQRLLVPAALGPRPSALPIRRFG